MAYKFLALGDANPFFHFCFPFHSVSLTRESILGNDSIVNRQNVDWINSLEIGYNRYLIYKTRLGEMRLARGEIRVML